MRRTPVCLVLGFCLLLLVGCGKGTQRVIAITSEPAGALVRLNDEAVGRTPVQVPFTWYGVYDVQLDLPGYEPLWTQREAKPPWWEYPGPDLAAELLADATVQIDWHFDLDPQVPPGEVDAEALLDRARDLQRQTNDAPEPPAE